MSRELLQQALHHLVDLADDLRRIPNDIAQTISALEAALAQPEQEPVAWVDKIWMERPDLAREMRMNSMFSRCQLSDQQVPLYTAPPKPEQKELLQFKDGKWSYVRKPWQGLTDEEILSAAKEVPITCIRQRDYDLHFAPIIEAKLKELNT